MNLSRSIPLDNLEATAAISIACEALKQMGCSLTVNDKDLIVAKPVDDDDPNSALFRVSVLDDKLSIIADPEEAALSANEKEVERFISAFVQLKTSATPEDLALWNASVNSYKISGDAIHTEQEGKDEQVLAESGQHPYLTYSLIGMNVIIFVIMVLTGVGIFAPEAPDLVKWGGNFGPFTKDGEWWRLFTAMFIHIGVVHLVFNMYALLIVGVHLEPILGKARFIAAYVSTGIIASVVSIWWHEEPVVSAGASGAIFGMYGLFLALLSTSLIPKQIRMQLLQGIGIFVGYNLLNGLKDGIDNAAHIGGLVSGLIAGYILYFAIRREEGLKRSPYPALLILVATGVVTYLFLQRSAPLEVKDDSEKFSRTMEHFGALEELALEAMNPADTVSEETYIKELKKTALTDWVECVNLFEEAEKMALSPRLKVLRKDMLQYSNHRVQQTLLTIKAAEERTERYKPGIDSIEEEIKLIIEKVQAGSSPTQDL